MIHAAFFWLTLFIIWIGPSLLVARLATNRGRSFGGWFVAALLLFWPLILVVVLVLPRRDSVA